MANKYCKIHAISLALRRIQNTTSLSSHLTLVRMAPVEHIQRTSMCDVATPSPANQGTQPPSNISTDALGINAHAQICWWGLSPEQLWGRVSCPGLIITSSCCVFSALTAEEYILFVIAGHGPVLDFPMAWLLMCSFYSSMFSMLRLVENPAEYFLFLKFWFLSEHKLSYQ